MPTQKRRRESSQNRIETLFLFRFFFKRQPPFWCFCCGGVPDSIGEFSFHPLSPLLKLGSKAGRKKIGHTEDDDNDGLGDNYRLYGCREGCHVRRMDELKTALDSVDDAPLVIVLQGGCHFSALVPKESCGIDTRRRSSLLLELGLLNSSVNTGNAARRRVAIAEGGAGTVSASTVSESTVSARTVSASSVQSRAKPAFPAFDALNTAPAVRPSAAAAPIDNTAEVAKLRRQLAAAKRMLARVDTVIDSAATSSGIPIGGESATRTLEQRLNFVNRVSDAAATRPTKRQRIKVSLGSTELQPSDCWENAPASSELGNWRTRALRAIQAHVKRELFKCGDALPL